MGKICQYKTRCLLRYFAHFEFQFVFLFRNSKVSTMSSGGSDWQRGTNQYGNRYDHRGDGAAQGGTICLIVLLVFDEPFDDRELPL